MCAAPAGDHATDGPGTRCARKREPALRLAAPTAGVTLTAPSPVAVPRAAWRGVLAAMAAPLLIAVAVQSFGNLLFHAVVGRLLTPDQYGAAGAVLAVMTLLAVPLTAVQTAASLTTAFGWDRTSARSSLLRVAVVAAVVGGALTLASGGLVEFFHLTSAADAAVLGPYLAVSVVLAVARGQLLGAGLIRPVASTYVLGTAARLALGAALVPAVGVTGALLATLLGETAALGYGVTRSWSRSGTAERTGLGLRTVGFAAFAMTGLFLFSTADLLLARHFLDGVGSGAYVAAATIGKTVLALPAALLGAHVPRLARAWREGRPRQLVMTVGLVSGLAAVGAVVVAAAPGLVLTALYGGGSYAEHVPLVRMLAVVAGLTSVVSALTYAAVARRGWTVVIPWLGAVLEIALIAWNHSDATQVAMMSVAALVPTIGLLSIAEGTAWARRRSASM
jgi:O-antigen/teichoic acid export membrane protein